MASHLRDTTLADLFRSHLRPLSLGLLRPDRPRLAAGFERLRRWLGETAAWAKTAP